VLKGLLKNQGVFHRLAGTPCRILANAVPQNSPRIVGSHKTDISQLAIYAMVQRLLVVSGGGYARRELFPRTP
jgi:hypothetical protein